jgi:hypothetical protein
MATATKIDWDAVSASYVAATGKSITTWPELKAALATGQSSTDPDKTSIKTPWHETYTNVKLACSLFSTSDSVFSHSGSGVSIVINAAAETLNVLAARQGLVDAKTWVCKTFGAVTETKVAALEGAANTLSVKS